ncbi:MAG: hypothetical protein M0Z51_05400 [Propionibacterium sp.]|nr:hypothetical protein [Propionibacterium sp.]
MKPREEVSQRDALYCEVYGNKSWGPHFKTGAKIIMTSVNNELAARFDEWAALIEEHPGSVIGKQVRVEVGPGYQGGTVIGERVELSVGAGFTGSAIGQVVSVVVGQRSTQEAVVIKEMRDAAKELRKGSPPVGWLRDLTGRAARYGDHAWTSTVRGVTEGILNHYDPGR